MAQDTNETPPQVCILLALYQGAPYLRAQLDSFAAQSHAHWSLIASDDGSTDESADIIQAFHKAHPAYPVTLRPGPRQGFVRNFLSLLRCAPPDTPFVALSDQDDVWFDDKLARAVRRLSDVARDVPALYCARTMICDRDLRPLGLSGAFRRAPDFRNALVQSIGGGNTMVLNRAALNLAAAAAREATDPVAHDWWLYQLITACGGQVIHDSEPVLSYRQHAGNQIGGNRTMRARLSRILAVQGGRVRRWNDTSLGALSGSAHRFTPQARRIMAQYQAARSGPLWSRLKALRASGVYRQSRSDSLGLYVACLLNRL